MFVPCQRAGQPSRCRIVSQCVRRANVDLNTDIQDAAVYTARYVKDRYIKL